jgi:ADP-ribose pyrophosphatase YjhB (NUDIX family)
MGLISGLLTLPLAPVRGTAWIAERLQDQAEREVYDEASIRVELMELEALRDSGEVDEEELVNAEDALIERLVVARGFAEEGRSDGQFEE